MRVIGAGLAVFLAVTAILLYQVSTGGGEHVAVAVIASPESTPTPASSPTAQPTPPLPTATATVPLPTATIVPAIPTSEPDVTEIEDEPEPAETEAVEPVWEDEVPEDAPANETADVEDGFSESVLAGVDASDGWSHAIETPNGGVIGIIVSGMANVRVLPAVDADVIYELHSGWPVAIYGAAVGDFVSGSEIWYQVSGGGYISSALVQPFVPSEPDVYYSGHWVDVDLTSNIAIAYVDDVAVNAVIVISGKPGFETPVGEHTIFARVENETLDSSTVGIPEGDPEYYYLPDVPYTQYFATGGFAIHANYWSDPWQFGTDSSHGCINMFEEDAAWFWWFLEAGSVVNIHY